MRIHIVQKGDTLWEIAKQYGADFEQVKQLNPQLSSPDMIMPGMKIKIPASSKPVKKEEMQHKEVQKETQKPIAEKPYKDTSPKPMPVTKEDDVKQPKDIKPKMPMQPKMPSMEQEMNYYTTINLPQIPAYKQPEDKPIEKEKICCHSLPKPDLAFYQHEPCPPPPAPQVSPYSGGYKDCGCGGPKPMQMPVYHQPMPMPHYSVPKPMEQPMQMHPMYHHQGQMPQLPHYGNMMEQPSYMNMPESPSQNHNMTNHGAYGPKFPPKSMGMQHGYHNPQMPPSTLPYNSHAPMPQPPGFDTWFREDEEDSANE
ncbi:SafA/ExsA family spore coat assembly protein [Lentibacillus jeotgali]|uniref:SafA/ExsA family spore coat assembly protein n=1 Tax=Lentibacillus jeotgali TaxID=558169 RepID=UPI0002626C35|nr:SafA/ExsA family spore coat assembly protein [Lentibacillus jeotgali]